jgi:hypothetical protein
MSLVVLTVRMSMKAVEILLAITTGTTTLEVLVLPAVMVLVVVMGTIEIVVVAATTGPVIIETAVAVTMVLEVVVATGVVVTTREEVISPQGTSPEFH